MISAEDKEINVKTEDYKVDKTNEINCPNIVQIERDVNWLDADVVMTQDYMSDLKIMGHPDGSSFNYKDVNIHKFPYDDERPQNFYNNEYDREMFRDFVSIMLGENLDDKTLLIYIQVFLFLTSNTLHLVLLLDNKQGSENKEEPKNKGFPSECTNPVKSLFIFNVVWIVLFSLYALPMGSICWTWLKTNQTGFAKYKALGFNSCKVVYMTHYVFTITNVFLFEFKLKCDQERLIYIPILLLPIIAWIVSVKIKLPEMFVILITNISNSKILAGVVVSERVTFLNNSMVQRIKEIRIEMN